MKTKETLQNEIAHINATIEKLKTKGFDDLNEADERNVKRNLQEAESKLEIAKRELKLIK